MPRRSPCARCSSSSSTALSWSTGLRHHLTIDHFVADLRMGCISIAFFCALWSIKLLVALAFEWITSSSGESSLFLSSPLLCIFFIIYVFRRGAYRILHCFVVLLLELIQKVRLTRSNLCKSCGISCLLGWRSAARTTVELVRNVDRFHDPYSEC